MASGPAPAAEDGCVLDLADAADRDAVVRTLDGNTEAFSGVVRRHGSRLVTLCRRMVGSLQLGEELAQEAFARAYSSLGSWRGDGPFRYWLYRVAMNCCRDYLKAGARAERPTEIASDQLATLHTPESEAAGHEILVALEAAITQLPRKYREAFVLFHVENLAYEEIEAMTGTSISALKVRVHRARLMLRSALGELLDEV